MTGRIISANSSIVGYTYLLHTRKKTLTEHLELPQVSAKSGVEATGQHEPPSKQPLTHLRFASFRKNSSCYQTQIEEPLALPILQW